MTETRDPYTVEYFIGRSAIPPFKPKWVEVIDVPTTNVASIRRALASHGCQWTLRRRWRIVDRQGNALRQFEPQPLSRP